MQTVIDNLILNYEVLGTKNTNTILILHGWKRNLSDWVYFANSMSDSFKVVIVDLPGMGGSTLPTNALKTKDYANIVSKLISKLELKNIILMGHSFGGKIATIIASYDSSVKKLILVDASGIDKKDPNVKIKKTFAKIIKPLNPFLPQAFKNIFLSDDYKDAGNLLGTFKNIVSENVEAEAQKIKVPTLIIWGDKDKEVTLKSARRFKELIRNSTLRIVWNAAHDPFIEKPEKFKEIFEEFITDSNI